MDPAFIVFEMGHRVRTFAINRELIPGGKRGVSNPRPFIAHIGPDPSSLCLTCSRILHLNGGVIRKEGLTCFDMFGYFVRQ